MLWIGSQWLTYRINQRGKFASRRTTPLAYFPEAIRLRDLSIHVRESSSKVLRRKHEPRALVSFMKQKTKKQPNSRLHRSLRTLQGLDYLHCLRGLDEVSFWDYDVWLQKEKKRCVRDFTFVSDVNNAVRRPKEGQDRRWSQIENLAPLLAYVPADEEVEALKSRERRDPDAVKGFMCPQPDDGLVPGGPKLIVIEDSSEDEDERDEGYDTDSDPGPQNPGPRPGGDDGDDSDGADSDSDQGGGGGGNEAAPIRQESLYQDPIDVDRIDMDAHDIGQDRVINFEFENREANVIESDDESTVRGDSAGPIDLTGEDEEAPCPRNSNLGESGLEERSLFVSDDEMEDQHTPRTNHEHSPVLDVGLTTASPTGTSNAAVLHLANRGNAFFTASAGNQRPESTPFAPSNLFTGSPARAQREESSLFTSPTPYGHIVTPGSARRRENNLLMTPVRSQHVVGSAFARSTPAPNQWAYGRVTNTPTRSEVEESSLFASPTPYDQIVSPASSGANSALSYRPAVPRARTIMDLTEDLTEDAEDEPMSDASPSDDTMGQKRAHPGESAEQDGSKRSRTSSTQSD